MTGTRGPRPTRRRLALRAGAAVRRRSDHDDRVPADGHDVDVSDRACNLTEGEAAERWRCMVEQRARAGYYCSVFPNSEISRVAHYTDAGPGPADTVVTVDFHLDGEPFTAINGGPQFPFTEAVSLLVDCADQAEVDHYWNSLSAAGRTSMCGWLKDRYGRPAFAQYRGRPRGRSRAVGAPGGRTP